MNAKAKLGTVDRFTKDYRSMRTEYLDRSPAELFRVDVADVRLRGALIADSWLSGNCPLD